jgi:UDP-N-acetylglucosamine acyltransferase
MMITSKLLTDDIGCHKHEFNDSFDLMSSYNLENYTEIDGNLIHKTAIINWNRVEIGEGNSIGPYACIGTEPPNVNEKSDGVVRIGNGNNFCEYTTVHLPTHRARGTVIGNNNIFMSSAHIGHDCIVEDNVVLCNNSAVAGHAWIMSGVNLAMNASVHQFKLVGSWSMVGMNTCLNKSTLVEPGNLYFGVPAKNCGPNIIGLHRMGVSKQDLERETVRFHSILKTTSCF